MSSAPQATALGGITAPSEQRPRPFRGEPRYQALLARIGLPERQRH